MFAKLWMAESPPSFLKKNVFRYIIQISGKLLVIEFINIFVIHVFLFLLYIRKLICYYSDEITE